MLMGKKARIGFLFTSRGCPYRCVFCASSAFWDTVRFHSAERIVDEIKQLIDDFKVEAVSIADDLFTVNKDRIRRIVEGLRKCEILGKVMFVVNSRTNLVDEELCSILKEMGVVTVGFGFESGSEKVLKYLKQDTVTMEDNKRAIKLCKKYGFSVQGSLMFASPHETIDDMRDTLKFMDWMKQAGADGIWYFITTPFPGTELWKYCKDRGLVNINMDWDKLNPITDWKQLNRYNRERPLCLDGGIEMGEFFRILMEAEKRGKLLAPPVTTLESTLAFIQRIKRAILNPKRTIRIVLFRYILRRPVF